MTLNPNPVKQYLGKIGIKQKYHEPVLSNQKRFYMIQIESLQINDNKFNENYITENQTIKKSKNDKQAKQEYEVKEEWEGKITFEIGCRESYTEIKLTPENLATADKIRDQKMKNPNMNREKSTRRQQEKRDKSPNSKDKQRVSKQKSPQKQKPVQQKGPKVFKERFNTAINHFHSKTFRNEMHLFPFEKEQVMTVRFQVVQQVKKDKSKEYKKEYGYALVPLVPFIKMPYTQHMVEVDLVVQNQKKQIKKTLVASLNMSLYFMHNFKARLFVEVVRADLQRNLAMIGQMYPLIRMYLRDHEFQTDVIEQGGIKPYWKSQKQDEFCYFNIPLESVQDDLYISLFYNRQVTIDEIVGKLKIDLQEETIFKKGFNMERFIEHAIEKIQAKVKEDQKKAMKNQEQERKKKKQTQKQKQVRDQEEKGKSKTKAGMQAKTKQEVLQIRVKEMSQNLKTNRFKIYKKKLQQTRRTIIRDLITKSHTLDLTKPPQFLTQFVNQFQAYFKQQYKPIDKAFLEQYNNLMVQNKQLSSYLEWKMGEYLRMVEPRQEIMKVLLNEMKEVGKIIGDKDNMISREIELKYINPFPKNQLDTQRTVGILEFRTFFVYEFQYLIKDKEVYAENTYF